MSAIIDWFVVPLSYPFMQRALVVAVLVGAVCAVLSCYLVLKGWSLMGDAVSHAVLPGIVIAYVVGLPLAVGAFVAGLACALLTGYLKESSRVKEDTVMGVVFTELTINAADEPVTIKMVNTGAALHNFSIDSLDISVDVNPGDTVDVVIPAGTAPGTYDFYCNVPGHKEAGMVGTLTVE